MKYIRITVIFLIAALLTISVNAQGVAQENSTLINPPISLWTKNISGSMAGKHAYFPQILVEGSTIHCTWVTDSAYAQRLIIYNRSTDNGKTWEQPRIVYSYPSYAGGGHNDGGRNYYKMVVSGTSVHFFVSDYNKRGTWYGRLIHIRSLTNGQSFETPVSLFEGNDAYHIYNVLPKVQGNTLSVVFLHKCNWTSADTCYYLSSTNNGTSFSKDTVYTTPSYGGAPEDVRIDGSSVYIPFSWSYFYYGFNYGQQWVAVSHDNGKTFANVKLSVPRAYNNNNDMTLITMGENQPPRAASSNQNVYILGYDYPEKNKGRIYIARSANGGTTFFEPQTIVFDTGGIGIDFPFASITSKGKYVYVTCSGAGNKVYVISSSDYGVTFSSPKLVTSNSNSNTCFVASILYPRCVVDPNVADGSKIHIVGSFGTYMYSDDGAQSFKGNIQLFPFSLRNTQFVDVAVDASSSVHVVMNGGAFYTTSTNTDVDIFYRKHSPTEVYAQQNGNGNRCMVLASEPNQGKPTGDHQYDLLQIPASAATNPTGGFTIEARIKPLSTEMTFTIAFKSATNHHEYGSYHIRVNDGWVRCNVGTDGQPIYWVQSSTRLQKDIWTHIALTYDPKAKTENVKLYLNGSLSGSATVKGTIIQSNDPLLLGHITDYQYVAHSFAIDELRLWNRGLTEQEVRAGMVSSISVGESGLMSSYSFDGVTSDKTQKGFPAVPMYRESYSASSDSILFISRVTPTEAGNTGDATVTVYGSGFSKSTQLKLQKSGQQDIIVSTVNFQNQKELNAVFDIRGAAEGKWDIVASNSTETASLQNAITIEKGELPDPWIYVSGRRMVLLNRWNSYTIYLGNRGNVDATGVPFWLALTNDPRVEIEFVDFKVGWSDEAINKGYNSQLASLPIFVEATKIKGETFNSKVYPLFISRIPANTTIALHIRIRAGMNFRFKAWINEPFYQSPLNVELAQCLVSSVTERLVDNTVTAIPAVGCAYNVAKLFYNPFDDYKGAKDRTVLSTIREWGGTALNCGVNLSGVGAVATFFVAFVSDLDNYVNDIRDCQKRFPMKGRFDGDVAAVSSFDPNSISGPHGYGIDNYTSKKTPHSYTVFFENKPSATAPAHEVVVIDTLDKTKYDLSSFMFGSVDIGDTTIPITPTSAPLSLLVDLRPKRDAIVRIQASLDKTTGIVRWAFETLDPASMQPSEEPTGGFLPPNITPPQGEGSVSYLVNVSPYVSHKAIISNRAEIVFDANSPLKTNVYVTVIDDRAPQSKVSKVIVTNDSTLVLSLESSDDASGVLDAVVYMSLNDSTYQPTTSSTAGNMAKYSFYESGKGNKYEFYSIARDSVGNTEGSKNNAEVTDVRDEESETYNSTIDKIIPNPWSHQTVMKFSVVRREYITLALYDQLGKLIKILTEGVYDSGSYEIRLNDEYLPVGVYQCVMSTKTGRSAVSTIRVWK